MVESSSIPLTSHLPRAKLGNFGGGMLAICCLFVLTLQFHAENEFSSLLSLLLSRFMEGTRDAVGGRK